MSRKRWVTCRYPAQYQATDWRLDAFSADTIRAFRGRCPVWLGPQRTITWVEVGFPSNEPRPTPNEALIPINQRHNMTFLKRRACIRRSDQCCYIPSAGDGQVRRYSSQSSETHSAAVCFKVVEILPFHQGQKERIHWCFRFVDCKC